MKKLFLSLSLVLILLSSCGRKEDSGRAAVPAVNKNCMVEPQHEIDPNVTFVYEGKTYAFCCKDCIPKFKEDPKKFIAAFEARKKKGS